MSTNKTKKINKKEANRIRPRITLSISKKAHEVLSKATQRGHKKSTLVNMLVDDWGQKEFPELY
jgi:hypothetical protein